MRASSMPFSPAAPFLQTPPASVRPQAAHSCALPAFEPFCAKAFSKAHAQHTPVFLLIGNPAIFPSDASLSMQLSERTVPVHLHPGERPDVELLCQRAGVLFSGEGALPLCALLLPDARPFLASSLPPEGFSLDPSRLYAWLSHADRRFAQNPAAFSAQAAEVIRSFRCEPLKKSYSPSNAAHDLSRALEAAADSVNGGFGQIKSPFPCALSFLQHTASGGSKGAHALLFRTLDVMLSSSIYDPLDGAFFRSALTEDWRVFLPEKMLGTNAMLATILLAAGRRSEAVRLLDFMVDAFSLQGGGLSPSVHAPKEVYTFTPEQVCAVLGDENGLRACRLLSLLHQHARHDPPVTPSRFSPIPENRQASRFREELPALYPILPDGAAPEDAAFLRRALPALRHARAARTPQQSFPYVITEHCALAAWALILCGRRLGESRYVQAAQQALSFLAQQLAAFGAFLPASLYPCGLLQAQPLCGAAAALSLAMLTLGQGEGMENFAQSGLALLGSALHAFVRPDGLVMHTPQDPDAFFPRVPAVYDSELPSPAALLVRALRMAHGMRPHAHYDDAIETIWTAAAPAVHAQPLSCAALIDAMTEK